MVLIGLTKDVSVENEVQEVVRYPCSQDEGGKVKFYE